MMGSFNNIFTCCEFFSEFGFCRGEPVNCLNLIVTGGAVFTYCFTLCFHHSINLFSFMVI